MSRVLREQESKILAGWMTAQLQSDNRRDDLIKESDLRRESTEFLRLLQEATQSNYSTNTQMAEWSKVREMLASLSRSRAMMGFAPTETASFVFSLKRTLFQAIQAETPSGDADALVEALLRASQVLDNLALYTTEVYQKTRDEVIARQQEEMLELSTPVVKLWDGILALPLIGTLDSNRTQSVMEALLQAIVDTGSEVAIIDITGVPTVDTLVSQHLLKTVAAARLMGADCIISGIRPQIAQTIVHLGVDLSEVSTKASLADAFVLALRRTGRTIGRNGTAGAAPSSRS